jgi:putative ABC transport system permease protein
VSELLGSTIRSRRFNAWLFTSFGVSAVVIVGAGVLGLVAMATARRTREVGIRMALGSTAAGVVRQILREQVKALAAGLVVGGVIAAALVRFVETYLYEMTVYDPSAWTAAVATLVLVTLVASLAPALRASHVDPVEALRDEGRA